MAESAPLMGAGSGGHSGSAPGRSHPAAVPTEAACDGQGAGGAGGEGAPQSEGRAHDSSRGGFTV